MSVETELQNLQAAYQRMEDRLRGINIQTCTWEWVEHSKSFVVGCDAPVLLFTIESVEHFKFCPFCGYKIEHT